MNKKFLINSKYNIEGNLDKAENWLLENHPEEYFGANIVQVDDSNKAIQGGDFSFIAILEYYQRELNMLDQEDIISYIKYKRGISELHYIQSFSNEDFEFNKERNKKFYEELKKLRNGKIIKSEWNGDYYVTTYSIDGKQIEYCENMELGIPSSIKIVKECD